MSVPVQFPNLGLSFDISRVAFTVFGVNIYWYGVLIGLGMALAVLFAFKKAPEFGIDVDRMIDVIIVGFICGVVGGRLYYVLFVDATYDTFFDLIDLRSGGIAIYGGIIGAALGVIVGCKIRKVPLLPMLDIVGMGFLIGQSIGRWGNFFNQEAFGSNTTGLFGMISPTTTEYLQYNAGWLSEKGIFVDPALPVHPTFLYESVWCAIGFFLLLWYSKKRKFHGEIALMYAIWYGAGRAVIEGLRTDSLMIGSIRVSQLVGIVSVAAAGALLVYLRRKYKDTPLVIPQIPDHTVVVKVEKDGKMENVVVSWPAGIAEPSKSKKLEMAQKILMDGKAGSKNKPENEAGDKTTEQNKGQSRRQYRSRGLGQKQSIKQKRNKRRNKRRTR